MHNTRGFKFFLVLFASAIAGLFCFVPMGGEGTGLQAAWEVSPVFGIFLVLICLYAVSASIYFFIKNK